MNKLPPFKDLEKYIKLNKNEFDQWLISANPAQNVPKCWDATDLTPVGEVMYEILVVQAFRPDNLHAMMRKFVLIVMGPNFLQGVEQEMDMSAVVEKEVSQKCTVYNCFIFYQDM